MLVKSGKVWKAKANLAVVDESEHVFESHIVFFEVQRGQTS